MTIPDSTDDGLRSYPYRHGVLSAHLRFLVTAFERYVDVSRGTSANNDTMVALGAIAFAQNGIDADETISAEILERLTGPDDEPQAEKVRASPNTTRGEEEA